MKDYSTKEVGSKDLFGFTIKINTKKDVSAEDYLPILKRMSTKVEILEFTYEDKNKKGQKTTLHIHGIFNCPKNPYFKNVIPFGTHVKTERIYDLDGWRRYCSKNVNDVLKKPQDEPQIDNTQYMF